jgi:hypothetical protein
MGRGSDKKDAYRTLTRKLKKHLETKAHSEGY